MRGFVPAYSRSARRGHDTNCRITRMTTNHPNTSSTSPEFAVEFGHGAEMKENAEVEAEGGDVAAELATGTVSEAFGRFQFHDDALFDEHVDAVKTDLLTTEGHSNRILAIHLKPLFSERNTECSRIDGLDEAVPQLVINVKKAANDDTAEILLHERWTRTRRRCIRVIRVHSGNSAVPSVAAPPKSFSCAQILSEIRKNPKMRPT
jgi:hypothetical protein